MVSTALAKLMMIRNHGRMPANVKAGIQSLARHSVAAITECGGDCCACSDY